MLRVTHGKGGKPREVPISFALIKRLREVPISSALIKRLRNFYKWHRNPHWLSPA